VLDPAVILARHGDAEVPPVVGGRDIAAARRLTDDRAIVLDRSGQTGQWKTLSNFIFGSGGIIVDR
jgi:hypothetical protein